MVDAALCLVLYGLSCAVAWLVMLLVGFDDAMYDLPTTRPVACLIWPAVLLVALWNVVVECRAWYMCVACVQHAYRRLPAALTRQRRAPFRW